MNPGRYEQSRQHPEEVFGLKFHECKFLRNYDVYFIAKLSRMRVENEIFCSLVRFSHAAKFGELITFSGESLCCFRSELLWQWNEPTSSIKLES